MAERKGWRDVPTKGLIKGAWTLSPEHVKALRAEAMRRAEARNSGKPDASEVLREVLDAWLKKAKK
jgi:hypothetical protein